MTALPNLFNWRKAWLKSELHPNSRLILHTIGCYMNAADEIAWPSIERLVEETGLSRSSVCKYLDAAVKAGWLEKWRRRKAGEQWAQNHYRLAVPDCVMREHAAEVAGLLQSPPHGCDGSQAHDLYDYAEGVGPCDGRDAEQRPRDGLDNHGDDVRNSNFGGDQVRDTDTNTPLTDICNKTSLVPSGDETRNDLSFDRGIVADDAAEDVRLAEWIFARILGMHPKHRRPDIESWARDVRLMRERDGRTRREIAALFDWANRDAFWRNNILSTSKLRNQWDQLVIRREASVVVAPGKAATQTTPVHSDGGCCHVGGTGERCSRLGTMKHGGHWWCLEHYREAMDADEVHRSQ